MARFALRTLLAQEQQRVDIEAVVSQWGDLADQKRAAYTPVVEAMAALEDAVEHLRQVHGAQEEAVGRLPQALRDRLSFPTWSELLTRLDSRLPPDMRGVLFTRGVTHGELQHLADVDQGLTALSPRAIRNFLERR
jgi:hypothetical protein